jgi:hypothetical protein
MLLPDSLTAVATFDTALAAVEELEDAGAVWAPALEATKTSASTDRRGVTESLGMGEKGLQFF